jgi:hypothetical protein
VRTAVNVIFSGFKSVSTALGRLSKALFSGAKTVKAFALQSFDEIRRLDCRE